MNAPSLSIGTTKSVAEQQHPNDTGNSDFLSSTTKDFNNYFDNEDWDGVRRILACWKEQKVAGTEKGTTHVGLNIMQAPDIPYDIIFDILSTVSEAKEITNEFCDEILATKGGGGTSAEKIGSAWGFLIGCSSAPYLQGTLEHMKASININLRRTIMLEIFANKLFNNSSMREELSNVTSMKDLKENHPKWFLKWQKTEVLLKWGVETPVFYFLIGDKKGGAKLFPVTDVDGLQDGSFLTLHTIAKTCCLIPNLVWLAIRLFPNQVKIKDCNNWYGRFPLHYAFDNDQYENGNFRGSKMEICDSLVLASRNPTRQELCLWESRHCFESIIMILEAFPGGAKYSYRTDIKHHIGGELQRQLPLHIALSCTKFLNDDKFVKYYIFRVIDALIKTAPEALRIKDPINKLYPFQIAAAHSSKLSLILNLLLKEPTVLESYL